MSDWLFTPRGWPMGSSGIVMMLIAGAILLWLRRRGDAGGRLNVEGVRTAAASFFAVGAGFVVSSVLGVAGVGAVAAVLLFAVAVARRARSRA
ncbi:MAG: hypothetical protein U0838_00750 [Chloroflexota bacterium]